MCYVDYVPTWNDLFFFGLLDCYFWMDVSSLELSNICRQLAFRWSSIVLRDYFNRQFTIDLVTIGRYIYLYASAQHYSLLSRIICTYILYIDENMNIVTYLSNLFELFFKTPAIILLWWDRCFAWRWWIRFWISWNQVINVEHHYAHVMTMQRFCSLHL